MFTSVSEESLAFIFMAEEQIESEENAVDIRRGGKSKPSYIIRGRGSK
jgi:hypothetical protein